MFNNQSIKISFHKFALNGNKTVAQLLVFDPFAGTRDSINQKGNVKNDVVKSSVTLHRN